MKVDEVLEKARDTITVKRVFAEPLERDGLTIIGAAAVAGGAGGGSGTGPNEETQGDGAGFGVGARPVGAYVIKDGRLTWRPAIDVNRLITMAGCVAIAYLLSRRARNRSRTAKP